MTKSLVACVEDLFFRSKIDATARHLNVPVRFVDGRGLPGASREKGTAAALVELSASDCLDAVRKIRENEATSELPVIDDHGDSPSDLVLRNERAGRVRAAIAQLPRKQRATLILRTYHEMTHQEIADVLGSSVGAVKANFFHALGNLKKLLGEM